MTWSTWHERSEQLASEAYILMRQGNRDQATKMYAEAAHAEGQALIQIDALKSRTLGIVAVSAVSLHFKAREFAEAQRLAFQWLSSAHLPPFSIEQLRNLIQAIWTAEAMRAADVSFLPGQVLVSVKGGQTISGGAPLDLIVEKVQTVQSLFYRTIEFLKGLPHRKRGAPNQAIQDACRPWLLQAPPGSYQFSVAIQEPAQKDFFSAGPDPAKVADHFMAVLTAASDDPVHQLADLVPSDEYRSTFLKLTRNLAPMGKNFSQLQIRRADDVSGVSFDPESRKEINRVLRPKRDQQENQTEIIIELQGILRALHLEKNWIELLIDEKTVHINGLSETVDDVIGPMVNRPVTVSATRNSKGDLHFLDIELDD